MLIKGKITNLKRSYNTEDHRVKIKNYLDRLWPWVGNNKVKLNCDKKRFLI